MQGEKTFYNWAYFVYDYVPAPLPSHLNAAGKTPAYVFNDALTAINYFAANYKLLPKNVTFKVKVPSNHKWIPFQTTHTLNRTDPNFTTSLLQLLKLNTPACDLLSFPIAHNVALTQYTCATFRTIPDNTVSHTKLLPLVAHLSKEAASLPALFIPFLFDLDELDRPINPHNQQILHNRLLPQLYRAAPNLDLLQECLYLATTTPTPELPKDYFHSAFSTQSPFTPTHPKISSKVIFNRKLVLGRMLLHMLHNMNLHVIPALDEMYLHLVTSFDPTLFKGLEKLCPKILEVHAHPPDPLIINTTATELF